MPNVKDMNDETLWQALRDAEDLANRLRVEIARRGEIQHPGLFNAVGKATRQALSTPSMYERAATIPQTRWYCPFCKAAGWWTPSTHIGQPPTTEHDRPDGRRCRKAARWGSNHFPMSTKSYHGEDMEG